LAQLRDVSQFVDEIANLRHNPRQPWVGSSAFAHKGGMHVNAVQKVARSFEHIDPTVVGNCRRVLVSDLAGRSNIVFKAQELGFSLTNETPELKDILARVKELEHAGYEFEAAEGSLALLISKILKHQEPPFKVCSYNLTMHGDDHDSIWVASVKVSVGGKTARKIAEGDGPVYALDTALRRALARFYPKLKDVRLTDYKVRILDSVTGTAAITRVLIQSSMGEKEWGTVGASTDIIGASLQALVDSYEYALVKCM
jgi:2-isopropylmalate synthase